MVKVRAFRTVENSVRRMGFNYVAGVDEVGRGCLAGPVVAAAVVLDPDRYIARVCDSKTVTALERARLYEKITRVAARDAARGDRPGAAAGLRPRGCVPHSRPAHAAARRRTGRHALHGDRR